MSWPNSDATEGDGLRGNGEEQLCEHGMREDNKNGFVSSTFFRRSGGYKETTRHDQDDDQREDDL